MEKAIERGTAAQSAPAPRKLTAQTIKAAIAASVSLVCLVCLLAAGIVGRELADIGVNGTFSGVSVIGALFQGGKLSYFYLVDGEKIFVTAYLPTAIGVLLVLCIALFLALFLYQAALVVLFRKRGEDNAARLNAIGGWAGIGLGFLCLVVYVLLITLNIPTTYLMTAGLEDVAVQAAFYKVFSPSVIWLVLCPVCIVAGMIQRKIDSAQVVLLKRYIPSYLFMVFPLLLIAVFNLYPIVLQTVLSFKDYSLGAGIFNSPVGGHGEFQGNISQPRNAARHREHAVHIPFKTHRRDGPAPAFVHLSVRYAHDAREESGADGRLYPALFQLGHHLRHHLRVFERRGAFEHLAGHEFEHTDRFRLVHSHRHHYKHLEGTGLGDHSLSRGALFRAARTVRGRQTRRRGPWQRVWRITLPSILPIVMYLLIINLGQILKNAGGEQLLLFANAVTKPQAMVIDTWLYWESLGELKYSLGAAMSFFQAAVGMVLVFGCNRLSKKTTGIGMR